MDIHGFDDLTSQIDEIFISPTFKDLQLKKIHFSRGLKKVYIANTAGLDAKYIRTFFNLQLSVELGNNLIDRTIQTCLQGLQFTAFIDRDTVDHSA